MDWEHIRQQLLSPKKERLQGLDLLQQELSEGQRLDREQLNQFLDVSGDLLRDSNHKICVQTLQILKAVLATERALLKPSVLSIFHNVVEKLGDVNQVVRQETLGVLVNVFNVMKPEQAFEHMSKYWQHKNWRVRHGLLQVLAETVSQLSIDVLSIRDNETLVFKSVLALAGDPDETVRDAAIEALEEMYKIAGEQMLDVIQQHNLRPAQQQQIMLRLNAVQPQYIPELHSRPATAGSAGSAPASSSRLNTSASDDLNFTVDQGKTLAGSSRRGGFKDGGGVTSNGGLPESVPLYVGSERELRSEMEAAVASLGANIDWQKRMEAMVKVEGLVKGGAVGYESFVEFLKVLRDPLTVQVNDRRSAISKQACHLLGVLSAALGVRFEMYAVHFLPLLYKVLVITVQVMAEAADLCVHTILDNCHSPRVVPALLDVICKDKNAKMRQMCSYYLLQILEDWEPASYQKHLDLMEAGIRSACQDAMTETRIVGRNAFAAYQLALPEQAAALLRTMDGPTQEKLLQAARSYSAAEGGMLSKLKQFPVQSAPPPGTAAQRAPSTSAKAPPSRQQSQARASEHGTQRSSSSAADLDRGDHAHHDRAAPGAASSSTAVKALPSRLQQQKGSLLLGPTRVTDATPAGGDPWAGPSSLSRSGNVPLSALRAPPSAAPRSTRPTEAPSILTAPGTSHNLQRAASQPAVPATPAAAVLRSSSTMPGAGSQRSSPVGVSTSSRGAEHADGGAGTSRSAAGAVAKAAAGVSAMGKTWTTKAEALGNLAHALQDCGAACDAPDVARELEKVQPRLFDSLDDAHFKVVLAGMEVLGEALRVAPRLYEPAVDRLLPQLFAKLIDQKEAIRNQARTVLAVCSSHCRADVLVPALAKSLDASKQPKAKLAVLEYACSTVGEGLPAGMPTTSLHLRQWVARVVPLISDKSQELRQAATAALQHTYTAIDANAVVAHMTRTTGHDLLAMKKTLMPIDPDLDAQIQSYLHSRSTSMMTHTAQASNTSTAHASGATSPRNGSDSRGLPAHHEPPATAEDGHHTGNGSSYPSNNGGYSAAHGGYQSANGGSAIGNGGHAAVRGGPRAAEEQWAAQAGSPSRFAVQATPMAARTDYALETPQTLRSRVPSNLAPSTAAPQPYQEHTRAVEAEAAAMQLLPRDPALQARHLSMLTLRLTSKAGEGPATLSKLADCVQAMDEAAWASTLNQVMPAVLGALRQPERAMRELAAGVVRELAQHRPQLLAGAVLSNTINTLLPVTCDEATTVAQAASQAMECVVQGADPLAAAATLARRVPTGSTGGPVLDDQTLIACVRYLHKAVSRSQADELTELVPTLMPGLLHAFQHEHPGVRKAVVMCLADLWCMLGDWLTPHLEQLSAKQLKLVTIYVNRAQEQRA